MRSDLAVKWPSLISIKSEQVSKICSMVKRLSHRMHIGGSSPFNKKRMNKKRMANVPTWDVKRNSRYREMSNELFLKRCVSSGSLTVFLSLCLAICLFLFCSSVPVRSLCFYLCVSRFVCFCFVL